MSHAATRPKKRKVAVAERAGASVPAAGTKRAAAGADKQAWIDVEELQRAAVGVRARVSAVDAVREGLPIESVMRLRERLGLEKAATLRLLNISTATMNRRERSDARRLDSEESDRVMRYGRLLALAISLMEGDEEAAKRWLRTPDDDLGGQNPLDYSRTETGFREVERLINRIEHGVYS